MWRRWSLASLILVPLVVAVLVLALRFSLPDRTASDGSFTYSTTCSAPLTQLLDSPLSDDPLVDGYPPGSHQSFVDTEACHHPGRVRSAIAGALLLTSMVIVAAVVVVRLREPRHDNEAA
ncbi:MAG: hypothetical protein ABW211_01130, partial [Acidimicrobiia bacterium]